MSTATTSTRHIVTESPIGPLTLVRDDDGLTGLYFRGHWTRPDRAAFGPRVGQPDDHGFDETITQLTEYLAGRRREFDLPLTPHGSVDAYAGGLKRKRHLLELEGAIQPAGEPLW